VIDVIYYTGNKFSYFIINFILFAPLIIATGILLIIKRKKQCMIAGFLYLIGGLLSWIAKIIYSIILIILRSKGEDSFEDSYQNIYLIVFMVNILIIFFRLGATYLIKLIYKPICTLEEYIHEKEHAEFIQSLGQKNSKEDRLVEDEEITEEQIYKKNENPLITGRKKEEDNEDEEINFESS
jgi:hypothetical protein